MALFATRVLAALIAFIAQVYLAGTLGVQDFGRYSLALAVLTFGSLFVDFGYFASGARLTVRARSDDMQRSYVGAMFLIGAGISVVFAVLISALSLVIDAIFLEGIGPMLLAAAAFTPAMVAPLVIEQALKALGRVHLLGLWQILPRLLFLIAIASARLAGRLDAPTALALFLICGLASIVPVMLALRPRWKGALLRLREIEAEQRRFGRPLYVGRLANLATYHTDRLLLGWFRDAQSVGYYSLAMSFAGPVAMFAQSLAASHFREFASRPIPDRVLKRNAVGIVGMSCAVLIVGNLVVWLYLGPAFSPVTVLLVLALIASGSQAAYQPYNSWLLANGLGRELKRFLLIVAAINLLANVALIPAAGAVGAGLASAIGTSAYLVLAARAYRQRGVPAPLHGGA